MIIRYFFIFKFYLRHKTAYILYFFKLLVLFRVGLFKKILIRLRITLQLWKMFKQRKLISATPKHSTSLKKYGELNNKNQNQTSIQHYTLYAKTLLAQLIEQYQLSILKKQFFQQRKTEILQVIKKCDFLTRSNIMIKILALCQGMEVKIDIKIYERVEQVIKYLEFIAKTDENKFCELILMQKIDQLILYIIKCYPEKKSTIIKNLDAICKKFNQVKPKMCKMMIKKQYKTFETNLNYWITKDHKNNNINQNQQFKRISRMSNQSKISSNSDDVQQRLKKFDQTKQGEEFKKHFLMINQNKKKRNIKRSNSIISSSKRVSTTWGKQQSVNMSVGKQIKKSQYNTHYSKYVNVLVQKQISIFHQEAYQKLSSGSINRNSSQSSSQNFRSFYFYIIVKGNMRIVEMKKALILRENGKLKIVFGGQYIYYFVTFNKFPSIFSQTIENQKLKNFLLLNLKLKQNKMWNILCPNLKIQNQQQNENITKNIISQLLQQNEKYSFYGFIKKFNSYFFSKYESEKRKQKLGFLTIYHKDFVDQIQRINIYNWNQKITIQFTQVQTSHQQTQSQYKENESIISSEYNSKIKWQVSQVICLKNVKKDSSIIKYKTKKAKDKSVNTFFHVVRRQKNFKVISQTSNNKQIKYSNLQSQKKYRYLFNLRMPRQKESQYQSFKINDKIQNFCVSNFQKQSIKQTKSLINRKIGSPQFVKIRYEYTYIKKIKQLGYIVCKFLIFKFTQSQLILAEAYSEQTQKYYTFTLNPIIIAKYFNLQNELLQNQNLHNYFTILTKMIKIKYKCISIKQPSQFQLLFQIGDLTIVGTQLIFRLFKKNEKQKYGYVDTMKILNPDSFKKHGYLKIQREINQISKNLHNCKVERIQLKKPIFIRKNLKYNILLKQLKKQLCSMFKAPQYHFKGKNNIYYYLINSQYNYQRLKIQTKKQLKKQNKSFNLSRNGQNTLLLNQNLLKNDQIIKNLRGRALYKYIGRFVKDPSYKRLMHVQ